MHTYSVALRISGTDLDLAEVSGTLKLKATQTRVKGQPRYSSDFLWPESMWEYEVRPAEGPMWDSLEDGLRTVISAFVAHQKELRNYQQRYKVFLWCGDFSSSFGGGPTLSPQILKALGDFGVQLMSDDADTK